MLTKADNLNWNLSSCFVGNAFMRSATVTVLRRHDEWRNLGFFVGNGFIRSAAPDDHHDFWDGISYAFWERFPIQPSNLKQEGCGMHKCIPYEIVDIFMMIQTWVFIETGGTDKSVPYARIGTYPIQQPVKFQFAGVFTMPITTKNAGRSLQKSCHFQINQKTTE